MSYKRNWDISSITSQLHQMMREANDPGLTGFVNWGVKQDLYRIKWVLDHAIQTCPTFGSHEETWLKEEEQKKIIRILKE